MQRYEERKEKASKKSDEDQFEELEGLTDWPKASENQTLYKWLNNRVKRDGSTTPIFDRMSSEHQEQLVRITSSWRYKSDEERLEELAGLTGWPKASENQSLYVWLNNRVKTDGNTTLIFDGMSSEHQEQLVRITSSWGYKSDEERLEELAGLTGWPKASENQSLYKWLNKRVKTDGSTTPIFDRMSSENQEQLVRITSSWGYKSDEERLEELAVLIGWPKISENQSLYKWLNKRVKTDGRTTPIFDKMSSEHQEQLVRITSSWGYKQSQQEFE
jgi:truncated hemoglobin YjbI